LAWTRTSQLPPDDDDLHETAWGKYVERWWPSMVSNLEHADTFYINEQFCSLVDHASQSIPDETQFDVTWMQSFEGWAFLETPFLIATDETGYNFYVRAFGWHGDGRDFTFIPYIEPAAFNVYKNTVLPINAFGMEAGWPLREMCKQGVELPDGSRSLPNGAQLISHPARWVYTCLHLMSQRMSTIILQKVDRAVKRRAERIGNAPAPDIIRVITLRRLEQAREKARPNGEVNWHWQWDVRGHWRNQFYPSENVHKPVFVEAYIKGPPNMPFKSPGLKLFAAVR